MLLAQNFLTGIQEHLKISDIFGSLNIAWNKDLKQFETKSKFNLKLYQSRINMAKIFMFLVSCQVAYTWNLTNIFVKLHTVFNLCGLILGCYTHYVFGDKGNTIACYLNRMLWFEEHRNRK